MAVNFEEDLESLTITATSDKMVKKLFIKRSDDSYAFYKIYTEIGQAPDALSGRFTSTEKAKEAILLWDRTKKETQAVKNNFYAEQKKLRDAAKKATETD